MNIYVIIVHVGYQGYFGISIYTSSKYYLVPPRRLGAFVNIWHIFFGFIFFFILHFQNIPEDENKDSNIFFFKVPQLVTLTVNQTTVNIISNTTNREPGPCQ